jgi:hypothetical protein
VVQDGCFFELSNVTGFCPIVDGRKIELAIGIDHPSNNFSAVIDCCRPALQRQASLAAPAQRKKHCCNLLNSHR